MEFLVSGPMKDINGTTLVYGHLFDREVLELDCDDHGIILLLVNNVEIDIGKGDGGHLASVVGVGNVVDGLDITEVFLSS